jgi:uncharacterized membrane protein HdeD (DUF308 family)
MVDLLKSFTHSVKHWYVPLIVGILFIILGIYIFTVPVATYLTLAIFFSVSFLVSGLFDSFFAISNYKSLNGWGWYLVSGILHLVIGIYLTVYPQISMAVLPYVVGFTVLFRSFLSLGMAFEMKSSGVLNWGNVAISSILGILLSFLLITNPVFSGLSLVVLTALSFIFSGIASVLIAFNLRKIKKHPEKLSDELKSKIEEIQAEIEQQIK